MIWKVPQNTGVCVLNQALVAKRWLYRAQGASVSPVTQYPRYSAPEKGRQSWSSGCGQSSLDLIRQGKALEHMDPNVWSKYNSLVSVLQGDFY